mmetsp:Transcript_135524/g.342874  ORF Transcript_135524/g.342874 Transcript_135524/m.342874 type:complete len:183 (-) Transcript_135524:292-840(-)
MACITGLAGILGLAAMATIASGDAPYTIQLHWASAVDAKVGIVLPGLLSCFELPAPSVTSDNLVLTPSLARRGCYSDNKTYHGGDTHGLTVYDPPHCESWPPLKPKGCPSAGKVSIRVTKEDGKDPVVQCSTSPAAFPAGYSVECTGPEAADDGKSAMKFTATVVKSAAATLEIAADSTLVV